MRKDYPNASYKLRHHRRATVVYSNQGLRWRGQDGLKSVNLKYITLGRMDDDMIVPLSDGAMFILID